MITKNGKKLLLSGFTTFQDNKAMVQMKCTDGNMHNLFATINVGSGPTTFASNASKNYAWLNYSESAITVTAANQSWIYKTAGDVRYNNTWLGLFIGNGTSTPTEEDYQMEAAINKDVMNPKAIYLDSSFPYAQLSVTFQNITEEDVTISELGLYGTCSLNINSNYNPTSVIPFIIGRQILENPVTVKPNELVTFGYKFTV